MPNNRILRINEEIKRALCDIIRFDVKDPRISDMSTVTRVNASQDLKYAKVYISIFDSEEKKNNTISALTSAESFIRAKLNDKIRIRRLPILTFVLDDSIEYGVNMSHIIDSLNINTDD